MRLTATREALLNAATACLAAVDGKVKAVMGYFHLSATEANVARLTATNGDLLIRMAIASAEVAEPDTAILLPAQEFRDVLSYLPKGATVSLASQENGVHLTTGGDGHTDLATADPTTYPDWADLTALAGSWSCPDLDAPWLLSAINRALPAGEEGGFNAGKEGARWYSAVSLVLDFDAQSASVVAFDGKVMAVSTLAGHADAAWQPKVVKLLPSSAKALAKALADETQVALSANENLFAVTSAGGRLEFACRQVEGKAAPWRQVLGQKHKGPCTCQVRVDSLLNLVRRAEVTADLIAGRRIVMALGTGSLTVSSQGQKGESLASLPVAYEGRTVKVPVDPVSVRGLLAVLPRDADIEVVLHGASMPLLFRQEGYTGMVMAMDARQGEE